MFQLDDGRILVNEIAPRPHNSGHATIEACASSQFDQQVRTLGGPAPGRIAAAGACRDAQFAGRSLAGCVGACARTCLGPRARRSGRLSALVRQERPAARAQDGPRHRVGRNHRWCRRRCGRGGADPRSASGLLGGRLDPRRPARNGDPSSSPARRRRDAIARAVAPGRRALARRAASSPSRRRRFMGWAPMPTSPMPSNPSFAPRGARPRTPSSCTSPRQRLRHPGPVPSPNRRASSCSASGPGPLTLILPRAARAGDAVTGGQDTVGIPCPRSLARSCYAPWCGPRRPGGGARRAKRQRLRRVGPTSAAHVRADLGQKPEGRIDLILDGGDGPLGIESTIVDLRAGSRILRPGSIGANKSARA